MAIHATLYTDSACPWAYSATPGITTLRWRYREQLDWRLVVIGLREETATLEQNGYTPLRQAAGSRGFRDRYGEPVAAPARASRAIVAPRLAHPGREFAVQRALAFAWFTTPGLLDEDAALGEVLA